MRNRVREYHHIQDWHWAVTTLHILTEALHVDLSPQVLDAALGMHGASGYRVHCGLVEGALMAIGITGKEWCLDDEAIVEVCCEFAEQFEGRFGSLTCPELRPEGFSPDDPPHLCEELTREAVLLDIAFVSELMEGREAQRPAWLVLSAHHMT